MAHKRGIESPFIIDRKEASIVEMHGHERGNAKDSHPGGKELRD